MCVMSKTMKIPHDDTVVDYEPSECGIHTL